MKSNKLSTAIVVAIAFLGLTACNALKKMAKRANEVNYSVTPNPLEMHGDTIVMNLKGSFPTKYFHKKVKGVVTPVYKYEGGEVNFDPITIKGESVEGNGVTINYEKGGSFTHVAKVPYKPGMGNGELTLSLEGFFKSKSKVFEPVKVADGAIITPLLVQKQDKAILGKDAFKKSHPVSLFSDMHYVVNTSSPVNGDLGKDDIKKVKAGIKTWSKNERIKFTEIYSEAYASPEGELSKNDNLANERAEHATKTLAAEFKTLKLEIAQNKVGKGEDWNGFKSLMTASDIKDKELILRVLEMYSDLEKRELEIKNLAATYKEVADKILPKLRRSEVWIKVDSLSRPDEEIASLALSKPDTLTAEELLYAAAMTNDLSKKETIYKSFSRVYPNDWRGPNNVGFVHLLNNKVNDAKAEFEKASKITKNGIVLNNLGVCERLNGNAKGAMDLYKQASGAGPEVGENMGLVYIMWGDYTNAVSGFGSSQTFNAALAQLLNGNLDGALKTIDGSNDKSTAMGHYLKAVIGARKGDNNMVVENLKSATSKDASLKEKAKKDMEFAKLKNNAEFQAAVN